MKKNKRIHRKEDRKERRKIGTEHKSTYRGYTGIYHTDTHQTKNENRGRYGTKTETKEKRES